MKNPGGGARLYLEDFFQKYISTVTHCSVFSRPKDAGLPEQVLPSSWTSSQSAMSVFVGHNSFESIGTMIFFKATLNFSGLFSDCHVIYLLHSQKHLMLHYLLVNTILDVSGI